MYQSLIETLAHRLPDPLRTVAGRAYLSLMRASDTLRVTGPGVVYDDSYYRKRRAEPWRRRGRSLAAAIDAEFSPRFVVDLGCGVGTHLELFERLGREVHGVDGAADAREHAVIDADAIEVSDLRDPWWRPATADVVLCLEVAEHLPPAAAETLVASVTNAGEIVVWSAAHPGQGGTHHINERPPAYWRELFADRGYVPDPAATERLLDRARVAPWTETNLRVFREVGDA